MGKYLLDKRELMKSYNTEETAVKTDYELLRISNSVRDKAIYCHEFNVSKESIKSLQKNNNCVIGTDRKAEF